MGQTVWMKMFCEDWDADKLLALLILCSDGGRCQTSPPKPRSVRPTESSQFMGSSWRSHATLWLLPWGFIYFHGNALATKYEFRLISSWLFIILTLSKDIINMQRGSLVVCMRCSWSCCWGREGKFRYKRISEMTDKSLRVVFFFLGIVHSDLIRCLWLEQRFQISVMWRSCWEINLQDDTFCFTDVRLQLPLVCFLKCTSFNLKTCALIYFFYLSWLPLKASIHTTNCKPLQRWQQVHTCAAKIIWGNRMNQRKWGKCRDYKCNQSYR